MTLQGQPPKIAFPIVWSCLYASMGYAYHLTVMALSNPLSKQSLNLQIFAFGLNMLWTPLFFGFKKPVLAFVDITALLATVIKITVSLFLQTYYYLSIH